MQADLNATLEAADQRYDAVICVGTFTIGHVGPNALEDVDYIRKEGARCQAAVFQRPG